MIWSNGVGISEEALRTSKCPETRLNSRDKSFEVVSALCYSLYGHHWSRLTYGRALFLRSRAPSLSGRITIHSCFTGALIAEIFRPLLRFEGYFNVRASCRYDCRVERVRDIFRGKRVVMVFGEKTFFFSFCV